MYFFNGLERKKKYLINVKAGIVSAVCYLTDYIIYCPQSTLNHSVLPPCGKVLNYSVLDKHACV